MMKLFLFINTLKYLRLSQVYFRLYRHLCKPAVSEEYTGLLPKRNNRFVCAILFDEKISSNLVSNFLNHKKLLDFPKDWNDESHSKLWVYNLHYFEDLLSDNANKKQQLHVLLLDQWISANPVGVGNGWEPYTISQRIPNLFKAWQAGLDLNHKHFESLFLQASFLSNNLERHLMGNHLFANFKALLFAGVIFNNKRWKHIAEKGLEREILEQTLLDGANFELTPMYHSLMIVDMLDIYNLCQAYPECVGKKLFSDIKKVIPKMLYFMTLMAHNDGRVSFFNDSVDGIAPSKQRIERYAAKLGFITDQFDADRTQVIDSEPSGYMIASNNGAKLIFDAANVGPDYIPGHAHADTLSFELSIGNERVFVNTGISQYGVSNTRTRERGTATHNTVQVNGVDSSQVWSGFRVAKRARVIDRSASYDGQVAVLRASHDGYKTICNGPIHQREITLERSALRISDTLDGEFETATARFFLHPDLKVQLKGNRLNVRGARFEMIAEFLTSTPKLVTSSWHPQFGLSRENFCLECDFTNNTQSVYFTWFEI